MESSNGSTSQFDNLSNFRDVATIVNSVSKSKQLQNGQLFRAARPDEASERDRSLLVQKYHVKTIVDLRTTTELLNVTKKYNRDRDVRQSASLDRSNDAHIQPLKIPGINHAEINLNGRGFERSLMWHLSYYSLAKVIGYMLWGYRMEAVGIIGREVLQPRGLSGLALDTLEHSQPEIRTFFELLSQNETWPVMIHCTQGKDRTGLTVILVLLLCGVDIAAVTEDYMQSQPQSEAILKDRLKDTSSIGLDESFAKCDPELPARVKQHIEDKYTSIEEYLITIGLSQEQLESVRARVVQQSQ